MSSIKKIQKFVTSDGTEFTDYTKATRHEAMYKLMSGVKTVLENATVRTGYGSLHTELVRNPKYAREIRDLMNRVLTHHRNRGTTV